MFMKLILTDLGRICLLSTMETAEQTYLEFFSTEPVETLIKKRASFIVNKQQHRDTHYGIMDFFLFTIWRTPYSEVPDDTDGFDHWWGYVLTCDDPALCKAPYLAAKMSISLLIKKLRQLNTIWKTLYGTNFKNRQG